MNTELEYLIQKFLNGETTAREEQTLKRLLEETGENDYAEIKSYFGFARSEKQKDEIPFDFRAFTFAVIDNEKSLHKNHRIKMILKIAAVILIMVALGLLIKLSVDTKTEKPKYTKEELQEGLQNTKKALTLFTENLNQSFVDIKMASKISN